MNICKIFTISFFLLITISCSDELEESIKFLDSYKEARFLVEAKNQNILTKIDERKFIRFSSNDKDKAWKIIQIVDKEYFNGFKFYDTNRKESFIKRLENNNVKYRLVQNKRRIDHESTEFTELEELVLVDDSVRDQAYKLYIPSKRAYPIGFLIEEIDKTKWTYAEYIDHSKQVAAISEARTVANDNLGVIGFSCSHHSDSFDKTYFFFRYNIQPLYISSTKNAEATLWIENYPPYSESLQIFDYSLAKGVGAYAINETKIVNLAKNDGVLKYNIETEDENLSISGEVKLDNFKESIRSMLESCKRNQL